MPTTSELTTDKRPNPDPNQKLSRATLGGDVQMEFQTPTTTNPLTAENGNGDGQPPHMRDHKQQRKAEMEPDDSLACVIGIANCKREWRLLTASHARSRTTTESRNGARRLSRMRYRNSNCRRQWRLSIASHMRSQWTTQTLTNRTLKKWNKQRTHTEKQFYICQLRSLELTYKVPESGVAERRLPSIHHLPRNPSSSPQTQNITYTMLHSATIAQAVKSIAPQS